MGTYKYVCQLAGFVQILVECRNLNIGIMHDLSKSARKATNSLVHGIVWCAMRFDESCQIMPPATAPVTSAIIVIYLYLCTASVDKYAPLMSSGLVFAARTTPKTSIGGDALQLIAGTPLPPCPACFSQSLKTRAKLRTEELLDAVFKAKFKALSGFACSSQMTIQS